MDRGQNQDNEGGVYDWTNYFVDGLSVVRELADLWRDLAPVGVGKFLQFWVAFHSSYGARFEFLRIMVNLC